MVGVMSICSFWDSNEHLEVDDIQKLPLFSCHLRTVRNIDSTKCDREGFDRLVGSLSAGETAIVTKSPEIVALLHIATLDRPGDGIFVVFDSHPRPEHPLGAAFTVCKSSVQAATYLHRLFRVDESILDNEDNQWQTLFLSRFDAHILRGKDSTDVDQVRAMYTANIRLLRAKEQLKEAAVRDMEIQGKLSHVKKALEEQRRARREASAAEADTERRLQALRVELESARELAQSIRSTSDALHSGEIHRQDARQHFTAHVTEPKVRKRSLPAKPNPGQPSFPIVDDEAATYERVRLARIAESAKSRTPARPASGVESPQSIRSQTRGNAQDDLATALQLQAQERDDFEHARRLQLEEERIRAQYEQLRAAYEIFHCEICQEDCSIDHVSRGSCAHPICRQDMRNYINSEVERAVWPILCPLCKMNPPESGDLGTIDRRTAELVGLDEGMLEKWTKLELSRCSERIECPKCQKAAYVDKKDYEEMEMLWCQHDDCDAYWCKKCNNLAERGVRHTCDGEAEYERWKASAGDVRACPGCRTEIQRNEGCRHMTCVTPGCNTHFCDRCGQEICRSVNKKEIGEAVQRHYSGRCKLIDFESSEDED